jgi:hypothetical protein
MSPLRDYPIDQKEARMKLMLKKNKRIKSKKISNASGWYNGFS